MKQLFFVAAIMSLSICGYSQTKVFKEVSEDVSSQMKAIAQDGKLVGYLLFTQLEKASEETFNYKLTIMDENLNDIGHIDFKDEKLFLQHVSFEQDVICLAYIRSNFIGKEFKNARAARNEKKNNQAKNSILTQFVSLDGKIIASNNIKVNIETENSYSYGTAKVVGNGNLNHKIQLKNIPGKGFAMFYGDEDSNQFIVYDLNGKQTVKKTIKEKADYFTMLTSGNEVYFLAKYSDGSGGNINFEMLAYRASDSTVLPKYALKDKQGNSFQILTFDNDPVTNKPYVSGNLISNYDAMNGTAKDHSRGVYAGVFTINFNGSTKKSDITESYSYWSDGSQSSFSKSGQLADQKKYARQMVSFKDYSGNTFFVGSSVVKKTRWGAIAGAVITSPLIVGPILFLSQGTQKAKVDDPIVLKQGPKGALTVDNSIAGDASRFWPARTPFYYFDHNSYYTVANPDTKSVYLIFDDYKNITIYNVNQKKVMRTIPRWNGTTETSVYPAKEGHIMVAQANTKEKTRKFSIESL